MALMGLDVGTTGVKCTITDNGGNILSAAYQEYQTQVPQEGWYELDANQVWESTKYVIKQSAKFVHEDILGVSVSSFGESFVAVDENSNVLLPSMVYTDNRGKEELQELLQKISADDILAKTGLQPAVTYSLPKIMWIKKHEPEVYSRIHKILLFGVFILYKLGGVEAIDYTLADRSLAFNVNTKDWDEDILAAAGVNKELFPKPYQFGTVVGKISPKLADELGVSQDLKLITGAHDQICVSIGSGSITPGTAMDGMGSVDCIVPVFATTKNLAYNARHNYPTVPYINGTYTTLAYIYDGGTLLKWYRDALGYEERQAAKTTGLSVYDIFNKEMAQKPTNLLVLPQFSGAAVPYFDEDSRGMIVGLSSATRKPELYRGMMEGVAYELKVNMELMAQGGINISRLRASGGGSRSKQWLQIKADIFNKEIDSLEMKEAGTLGVVIMVGVAVGLFDSFEEAMKKLVKVEATYKPNPENVEFYENQFAKYKELYGFEKKLRTINAGQETVTREKERV